MANRRRNPGGVVTLQATVTKTVDFNGDWVEARGFRELVVTLHVLAADRTDNDETYDVYVTTNDGVSSWDLVHFPQIATTGEKILTARVALSALPQTITGAGVASNDPTLLTTAAGAGQGIKTLAAGAVRHGAMGHRLGHSLDVGGTSPSLQYNLTAVLA